AGRPAEAGPGPSRRSADDLLVGAARPGSSGLRPSLTIGGMVSPTHDTTVPAGPASPVREERKVVTALFADLVGSTALGERLDPEDVKLIVGDAIARIGATVEEFGGTIKDLAGDGVLALFGAPTSHEDDPERAIR